MAEGVRFEGGGRGFAPAQVAVAVEPGFNFLSESYRALFASSCATAFQHPVWLDAFYRTLAPSHDATMLVVTGRDAMSGTLVFVLPLLSRRRGGATVIETAHLGVGDYAHPVVVPDLRGCDFSDAVRGVLPPHDVVNIRPIRDETLRLWTAFLPGRRCAVGHSSHAASLSSSYSNWRKRALDPSFAKYLDRKKRRFLKSGKVELVRVDRDFRGAIDLIASIREGRFADDILQTPAARQFYARVAESGAGFARIHRLMLDGEDVAQTFSLVLGGRFYYLLIGADYERFGKHSPGLVLYDMLIEEWIAEGGTVFDFTIGDEAFKRDFGTSPTAMHALVETATLKGRMAISAFDAVRSVRRWTAQADPVAAFRFATEKLQAAWAKVAITLLPARPIIEELVYMA